MRILINTFLLYFKLLNKIFSGENPTFSQSKYEIPEVIKRVLYMGFLLSNSLNNLSSTNPS